MQFQRQQFSGALVQEMLPLLKKHAEEVGVFMDLGIDPNWAMYQSAAQGQKLALFTARDGVDRELVGYSVYFVTNHPHSMNSTQACQDVLYILPSHRGTKGSFIKYCELELKKMGVDVVYIAVKKTHNFGKMLEEFGFELIDLVYGKRIGGQKCQP